MFVCIIMIKLKREQSDNDMEYAGLKFREAQPTKLELHLWHVRCEKYLTTTFMLKFSVILGFDLMETKVVIFIFLALFYLGQPPENW